MLHIVCSLQSVVGPKQVLHLTGPTKTLKIGPIAFLFGTALSVDFGVSLATTVLHCCSLQPRIWILSYEINIDFINEMASEGYLYL